jgi:nitrate/nitrite transport system permease protein
MTLLLSQAVDASYAAARQFRIAFLRDTVLLPIAGFACILALWWLLATARSDIMPTPWQALTANWDYITHPFYKRGPGDLGVGWLLLASIRRVLIGFVLGAIVAIPIGFLIGLYRPAYLALNPLIQVLKPVSPLAWLPLL